MMFTHAANIYFFLLEKSKSYSLALLAVNYKIHLFSPSELYNT